MSLESGRRLGLTASLINVIMPVISIVLVFALLFYQISRYPTSSSSSLFASGLTTVTFALMGIMTFAGLILFILAMYRLSHYYNEPAIFKNVLYGLILTILGGVTAVIVEFAFLFSLIGRITSASTSTSVAPFLAQFIFAILAIVGIALVFGVVSAVLYWRAFNKLAEKSKIDNFKTAGLLYLIGTVLSIVFVGVILVWIAWILAALSFNSLKTPASATSPIQQTATINLTAKKYCTYCGAENEADAIYCRNCGKQLQ
jgi:uncharacterized membrane protein/ribosomal protein L40E